MSAQPVWVTPPGSLGTIPQGVFYQVKPPLLATTSDSSTVYYTVIAGDLPSGTECTLSGIIQGVPTNIVTENQLIESKLVPADVISKFTIRAYNTKIVNGVTVVDRFADQTFTITVTDTNRPGWITPAGSLGDFYNGKVLNPGIQLEYTNSLTVNTDTPISLVSGSLPPGLTVSSTGLIHGTIDLLANQTILDFIYSFTLKVTNGITSAYRTFSMLIWNTDVFNASTTLITADSTYFTASISSFIIPIITNPEGSIGTIPSNTYFAYQFIGYCDNAYTLNYVGNAIPPGLTLDPVSGFLYGTVPKLGLSEITYSFVIRVYDANNPSLSSQPYSYTLTVSGILSNSVTWLTPSNLGTIANGSTSMFYVAAVNTSGLALTYRLLNGSNSTLPQGLTLNPSGNIVGRVSFNTFALDDGNTTFDHNTTTFDLTCTFTVNAVSANGYVNVTKTFTITVIRLYNTPYNNLYIQCMPPVNDRQLIGSLLQNRTIFTPSLLYRPDDFNFGLSTSVIYYHAYGLYADAIDTYIESLVINHYWKNLILGPIETAQAIDPDSGKVVYEVVYSQIIDNLVNNEGMSVDKAVPLAYPVYPYNQSETVTVYPNSLDNMRNQVIDVVGQESKMLPLWMLSKQTDGNILGFTPAWVIAYTVPGASKQIAYNIESEFGNQLNLVDFQADRYELDNTLTVNWNSNTQQWIPTPPESTTFDINYHYDVDLTSAGNGYAVGNQIKILGNHIGGATPINDCLITVNTVSNSGAIVSAFYSGTANILAYGNTYSLINGTNVTGTGTGAVWTVAPVPGKNGIIPALFTWINNTTTSVSWQNNDGQPVLWNNGQGGTTTFDTLFDGGSCVFNSPADEFTNTNEYNKYLLYPRRTILG